METSPLPVRGLMIAISIAELSFVSLSYTSAMGHLQDFFLKLEKPYFRDPFDLKCLCTE
jgi:hypothetical protein